MATPPADPDVSSRKLRGRSLVPALICLAIFSFCLWLFSRNQPQLMLALAIVLALVLDAWTARSTLATVDVELHNPIDGIAGRELTYFVRMPTIVRPVHISRPVSWFMAKDTPVTIETSEPGAMQMPAPPRGVIRYLIFDVVARGPLGLFECQRRRRVWLPVAMHIGPPPAPHRIEWPPLRSVQYGATEHAPRGDDLFRGTRPYVRGDSPRAIHWPSTAHHGSLMTKEQDGTGILALRIVVHLPEPGAAAELTASRAAWLANEGILRGWLVQLVTMESYGAPAPPAPLVSPVGALPLSPAPPPFVRTSSRRVTSAQDVTRQLAVAGYGTPELERWTGITRVVSPWGDQWL